jgi:hypothetical protein
MSQQINLFNPIFLTQKKYFSVITMLQALGLIVLGSFLFYGYAWYQVRSLAKQTQEMTRSYQSEQVRLAKFTSDFSPQRASQALNDELKALELKVAAQDSLLNTLKSGAIGNTQGYSEYLRAFARQAVHGLWLTGFDINGDGSEMSLQGAVTNPQLLPAYIQRMNREEVMRGKSFSMLQMKQPKSEDGKSPPRSYVEFSLHSTEVVEEKKR